MRRRTRINKFGRAVDERGRRITDNTAPAIECALCQNRIFGHPVRSRKGPAHRSCAEADQ